MAEIYYHSKNKAKFDEYRVFRIAQQLLSGDNSGMNFEKVRGAKNKVNQLMSFRLNGKWRVLCIREGDKIWLLDVLEDHNYERNCFTKATSLAPYLTSCL
jgi:hypothetical protein